jgi:hypothetical protein
MLGHLGFRHLLEASFETLVWVMLRDGRPTRRTDAQQPLAHSRPLISSRSYPPSPHLISTSPATIMREEGVSELRRSWPPARSSPAQDAQVAAHPSPTAACEELPWSLAAFGVEFSGRRWGPRLAGVVAPRCPEVPAWQAAHPFPGQVAPPPPHAGGRVSQGADGRVHGSPAAPSRLGKWSSQGEVRRPAKELWAAPMASSNRFLTMLQAYVLRD